VAAEHLTEEQRLQQTPNLQSFVGECLSLSRHSSENRTKFEGACIFDKACKVEEAIKFEDPDERESLLDGFKTVTEEDVRMLEELKMAQLMLVDEDYRYGVETRGRRTQRENIRAEQDNKIK